MKTMDFEVVDTLLQELTESVSESDAKMAITTCRDTTSTKECSCGGGKSAPKPKPKPKMQKLAAAAFWQRPSDRATSPGAR